LHIYLLYHISYGIDLSTPKADAIRFFLSSRPKRRDLFVK